MNYIKELNAFYDWLETNSLSTSAIALWHALMHVNNRAGWIEEFGVATSVLCAKTGLSDRTVRNARNELKQKGRIEWKSRRGNQSAVYKIIPLSESMSAIISGNTSDKHSGNSDKNSLSETDADNISGNTSGNTSDNLSGNASALNKLNETKQNEDDDVINDNDPFVYYSKNIGPMLPYIADLIKQYQNDLPDELITEAFKIAVRNNARSMRYAEKIMLSWLDKGIRTMADYRRHEAEWDNKKAANKPGEAEKGLDKRKYSQDEIEAAARYIKKAVSRYDGDDVIEYIYSLGYPEEISESAIALLIERKELAI